MPDEKKSRKPQRKPQRRKKQGYVHKSPALNITVYDLQGNPLSEKVVNEILEVVNEKSLSSGLVLTYART